jgi:hypothetical protein
VSRILVIIDNNNSAATIDDLLNKRQGLVLVPGSPGLETVPRPV